jgi:hypothetical protein
VLGLEAVSEMLDLGLEVAVVEFAPRLMPRQLDESSSLRLQKIIEDKGAVLYLGLGTDTIEGDDKVKGVKLSNGQVIAADLVLLSTGVKPNIELAQAAGIEVDRGIVVDAGMRTGMDNVYAAGDVAQYEEKVIGLWPIALEMGRVAGANAAGDWLEYKQPQISTMLAAFDMPGRITFRESDFLSPGHNITLIEYHGIKIGILICYDIRFPELSRALALAGADLIIVPAAFNHASGPLFWELVLRSRAVDQQLFVAAVSPAPNPQASYQAWGHSLVVDPWGRIIAQAGQEEGILWAELDFSLNEQIRREIPLYKHRRRDLYELSYKKPGPMEI